ncbi:MAG: hypothetical protein CMJ34_11110 [Phycisphaerae bacterium]|nr:hypothetical protein [Phycisphaerae bacterium]
MPDRSIARILTVAWREFSHTALTKSFLLGAVVIPVLMLGVVALLPLVLVSQLQPLKGEIAVVDGTGRFKVAIKTLDAELAEETASSDATERMRDMGLPVDAAMGGAAAAAMAGAMEAPEITVVDFPADSDLEELKRKARDGDWIGVVVVPPEQLESREAGAGEDTEVPEVRIFMTTELSPRNGEELRRVVRDAVVRARFDGEKDEYARVKAMLERPGIEVKRLGGKGGEADDSRLMQIIPFGFMMLLWIATLTAGNYLLTSTIEEKSNKVMEVILSAVDPIELLWGKILGLALVSTVIVITYGGLAIAGLFALAMTDLLSLGLVLWCAVFFLIAYFTIAALMTAVGSAVNDLREAQSLIGPVMIVLVIPMLLGMPISENPNGLLATIASMTPPILPFAMVMRLGAATEPVPTWQLIAAAVIGIGSVLALVWAAARIFRVGILMQGKAPNPLELLRWIRQA